MKIQSFDSFEEMQAAISAANDAANASLADEQKALSWGSTWVNFGPLIEDGLLVVGRCHTLEEIEAEERKYRTEGEDPAEFEAELESTLENSRYSHANGYLFGRAFSTICPDGELGSTHRASAWPISPEVFAAAKAAIKFGTEPSEELEQEMGRAFIAWRIHQLALARAAASAEDGTS